MNSDLPLTRDLVLIGGGHTHALVLRRWGMTPLPGVRLTLINPEPEAPYSGMLPGHVAGHYSRDQLMIDLVRLARFAGVRLIIGRATGIDRQARRIIVPGRAPIRYDIASIDIGITSEMPALPGFADHAHPAKPLAAFAAAWERHVAKGGPAVVIGGGVAGIELSMAMAHRLGPGQVTLVEAAPQIAPDFEGNTRDTLLRELENIGVSVKTGAAVSSVGKDAVTLVGGGDVPSEFTVGAAATTAQGWLRETGLELEDGFVSVGPTLASLTDPAIFAVGDCAHLSHAPRPKAGVYAVREAPVLFDNIRAALTGLDLRDYNPQKDYLKLISCGARRAVADRSGLRIAGGWLWRWKDWIDRRFMAQFEELQPMAPAIPEIVAEGVAEELGGKPLCGGCAAKVGHGALAEALADLPAPTRADVLTGAGDDAAVLEMRGTRQVISTDTLRAFTQDYWLLARIAAVHALGDVWSMGAEPQAALAQITLPRMSASMQAATVSEIMDAARAVFAEAGADIVGGHSALGAELQIGFTVTGLAGHHMPVPSGARPGDALILTKPLGTGVILAAEMAMKAKGRWVEAALRSMAEPQGAASRALTLDARAMTDVTGFGLAGHLMDILEASGTGARIDLDALPVLEGAEDLIGQGVRSSLHDANASLRDRCQLPQLRRAELLFDPQTAGGLLAAVPQKRMAAVLDALHAAGVKAAVIGEITQASPSIVAE